MDQTKTGRALYDALPESLPAEQIRALNQPKTDLHTHREYTWNGWTFDLPPGVFRPGATSRMIHERVDDGTIPVRGRAYAAMGVGLGVEAICAGRASAREIYAVDVHADSVRTTERYYRELVGMSDESAFVPLVSDLFDEVPVGKAFDVITFNPPAVSQPVSADPDVVRNVCVGAQLLERFFNQITERELLDASGSVYVVVSNTADLREIVGSALKYGFAPAISYLHEWDDGVRTFLFRMQRDGS